jgi:hypothetical protein
MFAVMPPIQRKSRPVRIAGEKARKELFNKYFKPAVAAPPIPEKLPRLLKQCFK